MKSEESISFFVFRFSPCQKSEETDCIFIKCLSKPSDGAVLISILLSEDKMPFIRIHILVSGASRQLHERVFCT